MTTASDLPDHLTTGEVARLFGVGPVTVVRWTRAGKIHAIRTPGNHRRFPRDQFAQWLECPTGPQADPETPVYPAPGSTIPDQPGFVVGKCQHRVAKSEWRAGFRVCERCSSAGARA